MPNQMDRKVQTEFSIGVHRSYPDLAGVLLFTCAYEVSLCQSTIRIIMMEICGCCCLKTYELVHSQLQLSNVSLRVRLATARTVGRETGI